MDEVTFDESTETVSSQVTLPILEPGSEMALGALTVGLDVRRLPDWQTAPLAQLFERLAAPVFAAPSLVKTLRQQNLLTAEMDPLEIRRLDRMWVKEAEQGGGELSAEILARPLSEMLKKHKVVSGRLIAEIIVADRIGLNAGVSDITSDYWQGDEPKYLNTIGHGNPGVFMEDISYDKSSRSVSAQASKSVRDPDTGEVIGMITITLRVDGLY